ncbi:MAG: hypothetical protein AB8H12_22445 [Lewinella sp.]
MLFHEVFGFDHEVAVAFGSDKDWGAGGAEKGECQEGQVAHKLKVIIFGFLGAAAGAMGG